MIEKEGYEVEIFFSAQENDCFHLPSFGLYGTKQFPL